jgi:cob(I)alamin adenosyltransferase
MKIYTKTGDKGTTSLIGGTRVAKNDTRIEAYGTIDELNSFIGLLMSKLNNNPAHLEFLKSIQQRLFDVGAYLATDTETSDSEKFLTEIGGDFVQSIENEIDRINETLPPLRNFVLPNGSEASALSHVCRTIARRAERRIYDLAQAIAGNEEAIDEKIFIFINRLSDYFFVLARTLNIDNDETIFCFI